MQPPPKKNSNNVVTRLRATQAVDFTAFFDTYRKDHRSTQARRAIEVHAMCRVLHMKAQGRARVASTSHAMHHVMRMLLELFTQRSAVVQAESLQLRMHCAAAHTAAAHNSPMFDQCCV